MGLRRAELRTLGRPWATAVPGGAAQGLAGAEVRSRGVGGAHENGLGELFLPLPASGVCQIRSMAPGAWLASVLLRLCVGRRAQVSPAHKDTAALDQGTP